MNQQRCRPCGWHLRGHFTVGARFCKCGQVQYSPRPGSSPVQALRLAPAVPHSLFAPVPDGPRQTSRVWYKPGLAPPDQALACLIHTQAIDGVPKIDLVQSIPIWRFMEIERTCKRALPACMHSSAGKRQDRAESGLPPNDPHNRQRDPRLWSRGPRLWIRASCATYDRFGFNEIQLTKILHAILQVLVHKKAEPRQCKMQCRGLRTVEAMIPGLLVPNANSRTQRTCDHRFSRRPLPLHPQAPVAGNPDTTCWQRTRSAHHACGGAVVRIIGGRFLVGALSRLLQQDVASPVPAPDSLRRINHSRA